MKIIFPIKILKLSVFNIDFKKKRKKKLKDSDYAHRSWKNFFDFFFLVDLKKKEIERFHAITHIDSDRSN